MKSLLVVVLAALTVSCLTETVAARSAVKRDAEEASSLDVIQAVAKQLAGHAVKRQAGPGPDEPTPGPTPPFNSILKAVADAIAAGHASKRNVGGASPLDVIQAAANQVAGRVVKRDADDAPPTPGIPVDQLVKLAALNAVASGRIEKVLKGISVGGKK